MGKKVMTLMEKVTKLLEYLHAGYTKEINGRRYGMTEDFDVYLVCQNVLDNTSAKEDETYMGLPDMAISELPKLASHLSDDDIFIMSAELALTKMKQKR